jgi:hypothetical protein
MQIWESWPHFWYAAQGKNPNRTAPYFIFLSPRQSVQKYSFSNPIRTAPDFILLLSVGFQTGAYRRCRVAEEGFHL